MSAVNLAPTLHQPDKRLPAPQAPGHPAKTAFAALLEQITPPPQADGAVRSRGAPPASAAADHPVPPSAGGLRHAIEGSRGAGSAKHANEPRAAWPSDAAGPAQNQDLALAALTQAALSAGGLPPPAAIALPTPPAPAAATPGAAQTTPPVVATSASGARSAVGAVGDAGFTASATAVRNAREPLPASESRSKSGEPRDTVAAPRAATAQVEPDARLPNSDAAGTSMPGPNLKAPASVLPAAPTAALPKGVSAPAAAAASRAPPAVPSGSVATGSGPVPSAPNLAANPQGPTLTAPADNPPATVATPVRAQVAPPATAAKPTPGPKQAPALDCSPRPAPTPTPPGASAAFDGGGETDGALRPKAAAGSPVAASPVAASLTADPVPSDKTAAPAPAIAPSLAPATGPGQQVLAALQTLGLGTAKADTPAAASAPAVPMSAAQVGPASGGLREMTIRLDPEHLGTVSIRLRMVADALHVRIEVSNGSALDLLAKDRHVLAAAIEAAGGKGDSLVLAGLMRAGPQAPVAGPQVAPDAPPPQARDAATSSGERNAPRDHHPVPSALPTGAPHDETAPIPTSAARLLDSSLYL